MTDYDAILNDDSINCVVELMGGVTDAKDVSCGSIVGEGSMVVVCAKYEMWYGSGMIFGFGMTKVALPDLE